MATHSSNKNKNKHDDSAMLVLVGDSDIDRWPTDLLPSLVEHNKTSSSCDPVQPPQVHGYSGATLAHMLPVMKTVLDDMKNKEQVKQLTVVFCAGENDIGQNIRLDETLISFRKLLDMVVPPSQSSNVRRHLIFLGPKFEPWLEYDAACRKQYTKLSMAMERACQKHIVPENENNGTIGTKNSNSHNNNNKLTYVNCLTMFCGASGQQPGATLGGKAIPEKQYFDHDLLHLSREGYGIWKEVVQRVILEDVKTHS